MTLLEQPRLALARPAHHPLMEVVRKAGWQPVSYAPTILRATGSPLPLPWMQTQAVLILSPAGAKAAGMTLPAGTLCLVQGGGTADALERRDLEVLLPAEARAESLWDLLQERFPDGGDFVLARGERSRGFLETIAKDSPWRLHPWITHSESIRSPFPPLPEVEGVLAMSPLQAEVLAPLAAHLQRFAWGAGTAQAFLRCGAPAYAYCEPKPSLLWAMLAQHLAAQQTQQEESPC